MNQITSPLFLSVCERADRFRVKGRKKHNVAGLTKKGERKTRLKFPHPHIHITLTRANEERSETRSRPIQRFPLLANINKKITRVSKTYRLLYVILAVMFSNV